MPPVRACLVLGLVQSSCRMSEQQLELVRAGPRPRKPRPTQGIAEHNPVAEIVLELGLAHLDRCFEYSVSAEQADVAQPGVRVRVRFAGRETGGFIIARKATAEHPGRLTPITRVVSAEQVLSPELLRLSRAVADRWAGSLADVLRLAIPPRHARAEQAPPGLASPAPTAAPPPGPWSDLTGGVAFLNHLKTGAPRAIWSATPAAAEPERDWPQAIAIAAAHTASAGRSVVIVVPDHRDIDRLAAALRGCQLAPEILTADLGPQARYSAWLRVHRGLRSVVLGTRSAMFAPVTNPGLFVCWDDGDDLHTEPRAPYPQVREVLAIRSEQSAAGLLIGGFARTATAHRMIVHGWAKSVAADPAQVRAAAPRMINSGEGPETERDPGAVTARLPSVAWRTARTALERGPVLIQVPRRGYRPALACQECRIPARCTHCSGPLAQAGSGREAHCGWCARAALQWECPHCGSRRIRSLVIGAQRTAEELGRAFPGVPLVRSAAGQVVAQVSAAPALVIATPGAEPIAQGGYQAALLLDPWALLGRAELGVGEEALRRWLGAAALVRSAAQGGTVVLAGGSPIPPVEALLRWGPIWHAERELSERAALNFPPISAMATVTGSATVIAQFAEQLRLPPEIEQLGPIEIPALSGPEPATASWRVLYRTAPARREELARILHAAAATRSARKAAESIRIQIDPQDLL